LRFLRFFAHDEPSAWLKNAKKPLLLGFYAKNEAGNRSLVKGANEGTLFKNFADVRRSKIANPSTPICVICGFPPHG
jgi:hypothetical protein